MNFVYPLKSNYKGFELKHSIDQVLRFFPDAKIYLVTDKIPSSVKKYKLKLLKVYEPRNHFPHINVWNKIVATYKVLDEFILMNDDFFILEYFDYEKKLMYHSNLDLRLKGIKKNGNYKKRVLKTKVLLEGLGFDAKCYDIHQPMHFHSEVLHWMDENFDMRNLGFLFKTMYGTFTERDNMYKLFETTHNKISSLDKVKEEWLCFSTSNKVSRMDANEFEAQMNEILNRK